MKRFAGIILVLAAGCSEETGLESSTHATHTGGETFMRCKPIENTKIQKILADLGHSPRYECRGECKNVVTFAFDFPSAVGPNDVFYIHSDHVNQRVYVGPFQSEILIPFDDRLSSDRG